jgi:hypothetical protein
MVSTTPMKSVVRSICKRKKARVLGKVQVVRREEYEGLAVDTKVELIRTLVPRGLMHVQQLLDDEVTALAVRIASGRNAYDDVPVGGDAVSPWIDGPPADWQFGALSTDSAATSLLAVHAPRSVARLVRAVLATVRRAIERRTGRLPSAGEAFEAMLDHAFDAWAPPGSRPRAAHRIFARDGWRCTGPGCSSFQTSTTTTSSFDPPAVAMIRRTARRSARGIISAGFTPGSCAAAAPRPPGCAFELGGRFHGPPLVTFGPGGRIESRGRTTMP